jgi:hypothetical protein
MAEEQSRESEDKLSRQRGSQHEASRELTYLVPQQDQYESYYSLELLANPRLAGRGNTPVRASLMQRAQQMKGNHATGHAIAQNASATRLPSVQRAPDPNREDIEKAMGNLTGTMDFGKSASEMWLGDDLPGGFGIGMDMFGEMINRGGSGQGFGEAVGGGLTKALGSGFTGSDLFKTAVGETSKGSSIAGLVGSGMKMLGGWMGEKDEDMGVGDMGEYVGTAGTLASGPALAAQGVQEGLMGLYNTAQSTGDWLAGGGTDKFMKQGEDQLKGKGGSITQGYSMIANLIGSVATGDYSEMDRIGHMSEKGELGALPQLGSKLGDWTYNVSEVAGAGFGMVGDLLKGDTENIRNRQELMAVNNPLGKAVNNAGNWLGDKAFDAIGPAPDWMLDLF